MRQYASTHLRKYSKIKFPPDMNKKEQILLPAATEIPIQMMWGAEMHSLSNLVHYAYLSEFPMCDQ